MVRIARVRRRAFSLVELLVVMTVVGLLISMTVPSIQSLAMGGVLTRSGQAIADQMALARQDALSKNRDVQVRFIRFNGDRPGYRAVQLWAPSRTDATTYVPIGKLQSLPEGTQLAESASLSPLIANAPQPIDSTMNLPGIGNVNYFAFRFRSGGGTDLAYGSRDNYLTVVSSHDSSSGELPDNYVVVQVAAENGRTSIYRP